MRSGPLVSVVVPVYNGERFLGEALDSVLAQDYEPLELIVVDDGSTDGSATVAESREVLCLRRENGGMAAARNTGVDAASGELLSFIDADDVWVQGKVATQVEYLLAHPETGFVYAHVELLVEAGSRPPRWLRGYANQPMPGYLPSTLMARRHVVDAIGPFDSRYQVGADTDWLLRAKDAGVQYCVLPDVLVRYRIHGGNSIYGQHLVLQDLARALRESAARQREI